MARVTELFSQYKNNKNNKATSVTESFELINYGEIYLKRTPIV